MMKGQGEIHLLSPVSKSLRIITVGTSILSRYFLLPSSLLTISSRLDLRPEISLYHPSFGR